jgi:Holliday junction DNA helicase RuvA
MIRLLKGTVLSNEERSIILMVNGVGYQVFVPNSILIEADEELTLYIHTHVREDAFTLYGFRNQNELNFFELLLTINGVGPKMALAILDQPAQQIQKAIAQSDIKTLTKIPGLGKKKAERIILELKSKVDPVDGSLPIPQENDIHPDVILTLESLGYKRSHIQKVLSEVEEEINEVEEWIRVFLKRV